MKRCLAIVLAIAMCFGTSTTALAAEANVKDNGKKTTVERNDWKIAEIPTEIMENESITRGGTETWTSNQITTVGTFTMEGRNTTPVKTIGRNDCSYLGIRVDSFECSTPVKLTVQIKRAYTGEILSSRTSSATTSGRNLITFCNVSYGDKVQIFFKITDANGNYLDTTRCTIKYSYRLTNSPM